MPRRKTESRKITLKNIVLIALAAVLAVEVLVTGQTTYSLRESTRPADLTLTRIVDANCLSCTTVGSLSDPITNNTNAKINSVKTLEFSTLDAKALIMKYNITKFPAVIVTGEFKKENVVSLWGNMEGRMLTDAVVIEANPPYVDVTSSNEVGLVSVTYLVDPSCTLCFNVSQVTTLFEQQGMVVANTKTIDYTSSRGQQDIVDYNIQRIPAVIFSNDVNYYPQLHQFVSSLNATEKNGSFAFHAVVPPYLDLSQNKVVGLVNVILLNDSSCANCYNVTAHLQILQSFGLQVVNITNYDINSTDGQSLISKYNITKVPTMLISPDAKYYQNLNTVWPQVGTVASDGWYVFRSAEQMGIYRNITA